MNEKIQYLIDVFIENGYERKTKQKVLKLFKQTTKLLLLIRGILKIPVKESDIHRCPLLDRIVGKSLNYVLFPCNFSKCIFYKTLK